ncbi:MAG TPA: hypothetical protein VF139_04545 [Candidatus Polarisedimenticolaceae bacterium]
MSKRVVGMVLLLVGGLVIGWYAGSWGFSMFEKTVPAGAVTDLVRGGTRAAYRTGGLVVGVIAAAYALLAAWASPFFRDTPKP